MISVEEALGKIFDVVAPLGPEIVPIRHAAGRVLFEPVTARRSQPPFDTSVMDGYAIASNDIAAGQRFKVVGEAAAGAAFSGELKADEAIRIFTGAPVPEGATRVVIQEDVTRDGDTITIRAEPDVSRYIREIGADFAEGDTFGPNRRLNSSDVALLAAMNIAEMRVYRRPKVAILATGNELVMPGEMPLSDQIIASNHLGLAAMMEASGATVQLLPIARDSRESLIVALDLAKGADLLLTIGGASVGDHDLVGDVAAGIGMERAFHKVAMRPGKPLMAGRLRDVAMIGLPGNPVSAMICGRIFALPALDVMMGLPARPAVRQTRRLSAPIGKNGPREHYMRAVVDVDEVSVVDRQDSALLTVLASANALVVRPPNDPARDADQLVDTIFLN